MKAKRQLEPALIRTSKSEVDDGTNETWREGKSRKKKSAKKKAKTK